MKGWLVALALCPAAASATETSTAAREADLFGSPAGGDSAREADMFGGSGEAAPPLAKGSASSTRAPDREGDILGGSAGLTTMRDADRAMSDAEARLAVGGVLYLRANYRVLEDQQLKLGTYDSPNLFDLYLDARPSDRVRGFVKGRLSFDPTVSADSSNSGLAGGSGSTSESSAGTVTAFGPAPTQLSARLDQLWAKFDIERTLFVTVGRQPVKWGSGRVWNPTDFLQPQVKNPLDIFDFRSGVDLLKLHLPVESLGWNFYGVVLFDGVTEVRDVGGALRAEVLIGETEIAVSGLARGEQPLRLGLDISSAIGPIDAHAELALFERSPLKLYKGTLAFEPLSLPEEDPDTEQKLAAQLMVGADLTITYGDSDSLILAAEYLYNQRGYDSSNLYPYLAVFGGYRPFYLGKHYAALSAVLSAPGNWNNTTFTLSNIGNLSDKSFVTRLDWQYRALTFLRVNAYGMVQYGKNGEFKLAIDIPPLPFVTALANGFSQSAPLAELGAGLTIDF